MTNIIDVYSKADLIKSLLNVKKGLDRITTYRVNISEIGLKENPYLLCKVLSYSNGLCRVYYQHSECHYLTIKDDSENKDLKSSLLDDQYTITSISTDTNTSIYKPKFYDWQAYFQDGNIYNMYKELKYYISPITDQTRFINMLQNRITVMNDIKDFKYSAVPVIMDNDSPLESYAHIYVLKPQHIDAINILADIITSKLKGDIGYYIFIFKCNKQWFTLSRHREINFSYYTGDVININGVYYDINKVKEEVLNHVHSS